MRINRIKIQNFLGISALDIKIDKPLLFIAGSNCSGKTSTAHALRFVLNDELCRVEHKKNIRELVKEGAKNGSVELTVDGVAYQRSAATGHIVSKDQPPKPHPALHYVLDPPAFAEMDANARLSFLYSLMGVNRSATSITKLLEERGHAKPHIERIETSLSGGFQAAHQHVKECITLLTGEWRGVTGENYGSVKAAAWSSEVPGVAPSDITRLKAEITKHEHEIGQLQARLGAQKERTRFEQSMRETKRIARELEARTAATKECQKKMDDLTAEERQISEALGKAQAALTIESHAVQGSFFQCPACGESLVYSRGECKMVGNPVAVDVSAEIEATEAQVKELKLALTEVGNRKHIGDRLMVDTLNAVGQSQAATNALADLKEAHESDTQGAAGVEEQITAMTAARAEARQALDQLEAATRNHHEAVNNTQRATALHEEIKALTTLAADLAPDGLPGELLSRAMRPINERLRDSSIMAGWSSVSITTNGILIHSRPWALASGSERWRANAMIAEAIAHLSGVQCFVLDSLDILEPAQRAQALGWLCEVAKDHETVIVLCTLKAQPKELPDTIQSVWLGGA
ncbi:MAG: AAA family ATPase [Pseudomonadota bacterium]|nr:AAA family ATPase [Pseudomonadota bacterium]